MEKLTTLQFLQDLNVTPPFVLICILAIVELSIWVELEDRDPGDFGDPFGFNDYSEDAGIVRECREPAQPRSLKIPGVRSIPNTIEVKTANMPCTRALEGYAEPRAEQWKIRNVCHHRHLGGSVVHRQERHRTAWALSQTSS
eukprot:947033-Amphidinium_carterae.1